MSFQDDLQADIKSVFLSPDEYAVAATLRCEGYPAATINVLYQAPFRDADSGQTTAPEAWAADEDLVHASQGDILTIDGVRRVIINMEPDGAGMTRLELSSNDIQ